MRTTPSLLDLSLTLDLDHFQISPDFLNGVPQEVLGLIVSSPIFTDLNNTSEDCLSVRFAAFVRSIG